MKPFLPLILILFSSFYVHAQTVTGFVRDGEDKALANATVSILRARDSSVAKLGVSDKEGKFVISGIKEGKYLVTATYVGYAAGFSKVFDLQSGSDINLPVISLQRKGGDLNNVTVSARRPIVEVKADKTILNVEGTINAVGQDALELLRKAPGVQVDQEDNIALSGKNGVQIFIDGKPSPLAGKDLSEYLKTIQSAQIEAIEIITNPSAKYEAAGNAGIINIRLKRNKSLGTNGSVNLGYGIMIHPKYNGGLSLNHRNAKWNLFGTYNYSHGYNENQFDLYREVADSIFDQQSTFNNHFRNHNFKAGADYFINRFNTIGVMVSGVRADPWNMSESRTYIKYQPTKADVKQLQADNMSKIHRENTTYNINFRHTDTAGRDLNFDLDYANYNNWSDQMLTNIYLNSTGNVETSREVNNMYSPTKIDIYSGKVDYEQHLAKGRLGIGAKTSFIRTDNDFQMYNVVGMAKDLDRDKSNRFRYSENINAVYLNYNKQFKGWMLQAGLRMENTVTEGRSTGLKKNGTTYVPYDSSFNRDYTNLFPSAAVTFNKNPKNQWSLSYSRRIDRPAYQDLNPFEFKLNAYTYQKGNVELRPQFTHSFGVTNIYKYKLTTSLTYSHTDDVFANITDVVETSKSFLIKKNLATQDNIGLNISYPFQYKAYSVIANLNAYYSHFKADLGPLRKVDVDIFSYRLFAQNSLKLNKTVTAELSGWYNAPSLWGGTFRNEPMWSLDAGLQKTLFKGKGTIRFALSDVFWSTKFTSSTNYAGQYLRVHGANESRVFRVNFSYRFGNTQVKAARNRRTAAEDENSRASGGGGGLGGN